MRKMYGVEVGEWNGKRWMRNIPYVSSSFQVALENLEYAMSFSDAKLREFQQRNPKILRFTWPHGSDNPPTVQEVSR